MEEQITTVNIVKFIFWLHPRRWRGCGRHWGASTISENLHPQRCWSIVLSCVFGDFYLSSSLSGVWCYHLSAARLKTWHLIYYWLRQHLRFYGCIILRPEMNDFVQGHHHQGWWKNWYDAAYWCLCVAFGAQASHNRWMTRNLRWLGPNLTKIRVHSGYYAASFLESGI